MTSIGTRSMTAIYEGHNMTPRLEVVVDLIEVTMGGWFGGAPDTHRRFAPGPQRYVVDGAEVDLATFKETAFATHPEWARREFPNG